MWLKDFYTWENMNITSVAKSPAVRCDVGEPAKEIAPSIAIH